MKRVALLGSALALASILATPAWAQADFAGPWHTNQGNMHIEQRDNHAWGDYELKDGRVRGDVDGDLFSGIWTQSSSNRRCFDEREGSHYWGRFRLHLDEDRDHFRGRWAYCNDDFGSGGDWTGERLHHHDDRDHYDHDRY